MELPVWDSRAPATTQDGDQQPNSSARKPYWPKKISAENCDNVFCFLEEYGVLVCKQHRTGVVNLDRHLREQHATPIAQRRQVIERFSCFATIEPSAVELPEQPARIIEELGTPLDGLLCRTCSFITVNRSNMKTHCREIHERSWAGDKDVLFRNVKVQAFFSSGGLQKYFIVDFSDGENEENSHPDHIAVQQLNAWKSTRVLLEEDMQVMEEAAKTDKTGWFKRAGWLEHFKDRNLAHLGHQARLPDRNEPKLQLAAQLTEQLIEKCVQGLSTLQLEIRRWLRSAQQSEVDQRPLARLQNSESQATYTAYIIRFVCFYLRVLEDEEARVERFIAQRNGELSSSSCSEEEDEVESEGDTRDR